MVDKDFRIDYKNTERLRRKQLGLVQHQQRVVNVACQEQEPEETAKVQLAKSEILVVSEAEDVPALDQKLFKGLFGDIRLLMNGFVQYNDSTGKERREVFDRVEIRKTFPLGISLGGLTKSLWFKEAWERDLCFQCMSANPDIVGSETEITKYEEPEDNGNYKVFPGFEGNKVFVYPDNRVVYSDVDGETHNVLYKKSKIQKCFPNGICFGGLPRTIWFNKQIDQERCFLLMKQLQQEQGELSEEEKDQMFTGLYGDVMLKPDYEIEFTSLLGERLVSYYDPKKIRKVFPMGIASNTFTTTIWFEEMEECESCFKAMKETS